MAIIDSSDHYWLIKHGHFVGRLKGITGECHSFPSWDKGFLAYEPGPTSFRFTFTPVRSYLPRYMDRTIALRVEKWDAATGRRRKRKPLERVVWRGVVTGQGDGWVEVLEKE